MTSEPRTPGTPKSDDAALHLALALGAAHVPFDDVPSGFYVIPDNRLERILSVFYHLEGQTVHACPPGDSGYTPCCDQSPWELPRTDRMTLDPELVTCGLVMS